jgi:hypothetical protein
MLSTAQLLSVPDPDVGVCELNAPMVYLAPDRHAFLVLGDGAEPLITWSMSYRFACEQADIHGGLVVAVPVVRDSSWRQPHQDDVRPTQVPVPAASMPRQDAAQTAGEPSGFLAALDGDGVLQLVGDGYSLGRVCRGVEGQGSPYGWSSARDGVEGETTASGEPLVRRSAPFEDPGAPVLPADPEGALRDAFGGGEGPEVEAAVAAFRTAAQADMATLERVRSGLIGDEPTVLVDRD